MMTTIYGDMTMPIDPDAGIRRRCIEMIRKGKSRVNRQELEHIFDYDWWWARGAGWSVADMQKQCDLFAAEKRTLLDAQGNSFDTNLLAMLFSDAQKSYLFVKNRNRDAFAAARTLYTGELTPYGVPYTEYWTPPWYFSVEGPLENFDRIIIDERGEILQWDAPLPEEDQQQQ